MPHSNANNPQSKTSPDRNNRILMWRNKKH